MKILHVVRDLLPASGGLVTAVEGFAANQSLLGHSVAIATTCPDDYYKFNKKFKIYTYSCQYNSWNLSIGLAKALHNLISDADIIHLHAVWEFPVWAAARIARKLGKPYILQPCGMLDNWSLSQNKWKKKIYLRLLLNSIIDHAAAIYFSSEHENNHSWHGSTINKSFVLPIGLPPSSYRNLPSRTAFPGRFPELKGKRVVLFLGRLHAKKQPDIVIQAFQKVYANTSGIHLVMAGPGDKDYVTALKQLAKDLMVDACITFTGMLDGDAVREAYRAAELFVLPSLKENFGIAVAEAMAAGCPVVISNKVDLAPEILNAKAGLICLPDVESTALAMKQFLEDKELREFMSANGRRLVLEKFTWDKVANDMIAVYKDILNGKRTCQCWQQ